MSTQAQLEIITPGGQTEFHSLDPSRGVTNIGRHPDNDIVIDSPGVADFYAVLDHRRQPYQIMLLAEGSKTLLGGQVLSANTFQDLQNWDTLEIDGYSLILLEGEELLEKETPPPPVAAEPEPQIEAAATAPPPSEPVTGAALFTDQSDSVILTEISGREWTVGVEQTVSCQVTVVNGGDIVAAFDLRVKGVPDDWVTIMPAQFNLNEGGRAAATISFTPPRLTTSRAGPHPVAVTVTSPNYPGRASRLAAVLHVEPYYRFKVGDLSPKKQTVSWFRRSGEVTLPIQNKSNCPMPFRLEGEDDERGCRFEFQTPDEEVALVRQAEMRLAPDETLSVRVLITPIKRRLIALRSRHFSFTLTTSMVEGAQTPRSVMGRLKSRPLIGPWLLLMMLVGLATLVVFLFQPVAEPTLQIDTATPTTNQKVLLRYDASRFPDQSPSSIFNHLNALFLKLTLEYRTESGQWQTLKAPSDLPAPVGRATDAPTQDGLYRLRAENWLSRLIPWFAGQSKDLKVFVTPIQPSIYAFRASRQEIWAGEEVLLYWRVGDTETLKLEHDGIEETFEGAELKSGQRTYTLLQDTTFTLSAGNSSWPEEVQKPLEVKVMARPVPTPVIVRFDVDPLSIIEGETVRIDWEVEGADSVQIDPLGAGLPVKGNVGDQPTSLTTYQLTAFKTGDDGSTAENKSLLREVIVNPLPTPSPVPQAPQIQLFQATPKEIIGDQGMQVKLTWSVSGAFTKIDITNPELVYSTPLSRTGTITVTPRETTLYVLTAYNGDLSSSMPAEVTVLEPTPTPTATPAPTATPVPTPVPPTPTPYPPPFISFYKAEGLDPTTDRVVFKSATDTEAGTVYLYEVEVGARVKISWSVENADKVTIQNLGAQPTSGEVTLPDPVTAPASYMLTAENNGGANQTSAFLQFEVTAMEPPPAPYGLRGTEDVAAKTNKLEWNYDDQYRSVIVGFRIYRANVPPNDAFLPVGVVPDPNATTWTDTALDETCGKAYYVVAIYIDPVRNEEKETAASSTSWYSRPCP